MNILSGIWFSPNLTDNRPDGRRFRLLVAVACSLALAACSGSSDDEIAAPLEPQSYGAEESNVELWLETMEVGSRELYAARQNVVDAVGLKPGSRLADIGSGTGLYSLLFSERVGEGGVVYAVDIEPLFLKLINQRVADLDIHNVVSVLSREDDVTLPPASVDAVFIADTYHYFSEPLKVLASIRSAMAPDGRLIILDYDDVAVAKDPRAHSHIRFGKAQLVAEVESAGFELAAEPEVEGLEEIFMLVFKQRSPAGGQP